MPRVRLDGQHAAETVLGEGTARTTGKQVL